MWTSYAIEILELVERHMLERDSRLAQSAFRYLLARKKVSDEIKDRVIYQQTK